MKKVQLIAYVNRQGFDLEDLKDYGEIFYSPVEVFDDNTSDNYIIVCLENKYKDETGKLFNPKIEIKFLWAK